MKHYSKFFSGKHFFSVDAKEKEESSFQKLTTEEIDKEIHSIGMFIRSGLVVLSVVLLSGIAIGYKQIKVENTVTTSISNNIHEKKLPIYCVDQKEKKVALSFDAAWGNG